MLTLHLCLLSPSFPVLPRLQPLVQRLAPGSDQSRIWLPPNSTPISSITFLQMLVGCMLMYGYTTEGEAPTRAERLEAALQFVNAALHAAWPSSADVGRKAIERRLAIRRWVPDLDLQAQPEWDAAPLSPTAAALQRDLACHAPEISLTELRCLALLQHAAVCDMAPAPNTSAGLAGWHEQQLLDAQQVLALSHGAATGSRLDAIHYQAMHDAVTAAGREETSEAVLAVADKALELHLASKRE